MGKRVLAAIIAVAAAMSICLPATALADENAVADTVDPIAVANEDTVGSDEDADVASVQVSDGEEGTAVEAAGGAEPESGTANDEDGQGEAAETVQESPEGEGASDTGGCDPASTPIEEPAADESPAGEAAGGSAGASTCETGPATVVTPTQATAVKETAQDAVTMHNDVAEPSKSVNAAKQSKRAQKASKVRKSDNVKQGWYNIKAKSAGSSGLFVRGSSTKSGSAIELRKSEVSPAGAFMLKRVGKYYRIYTGLATKKSITMKSRKVGTVADIRVRNDKNTLFSLQYDKQKKGYRLVNVATGLALSLAGGKTSDGVSIAGARISLDDASQVFTLSKRPGLIKEEIYQVKTRQKGELALTAVDSGAAFYRYTGDLSQKWYMNAVTGKKNIYVIESISNGKRLLASKSGAVSLKNTKMGKKATWWVPTYDGKGIVWKNYVTKKPLATNAKSCDKGSAVTNAMHKRKASRVFTVRVVAPLESGVYELFTAGNKNLALEVAKGDTAVGGKTRVAALKGYNSQKWVYNQETGTLRNVNSHLLLDGSSAVGKRLLQGPASKAKTSSWIFRYLGRGNFAIVSKADDKMCVSAARSGKNAMATKSVFKGKKLQKWKVDCTQVYMKATGFRLINDIVNNGHGPLWADYIVIHETANPGATARNHRDLWAGNSYYADYAVHYTLDWTGDCYYCVPEDRLCWQVGNGNDHVIGIELCHATNMADFKVVWNGGVKWAAWQLKRHGWGIDRLVSHNECRYIWGGTDHTDPDDYFASYGKSWAQFKEAVKKELS